MRIEIYGELWPEGGHVLQVVLPRYVFHRQPLRPSARVTYAVSSKSDSQNGVKFYKEMMVTMINYKVFISSSSPSFVSFNCCCYCQLTFKYGLEGQHYKENVKVICLLYSGKCT